MRLLVIADMAQTGFGRVGRELSSRFLAAGVDIRVIAINWRGRVGEIAAELEKESSTEEIKRVLDEVDADPLAPYMIPATLLNQADGMGYALTVPAVLGGLRIEGWHGWVPEAIFLLADPRAALQRLLYTQDALMRKPVWNYTPIESDILPPLLIEMWNRIKPVAMSKFGQRVIADLMQTDVPYIPHGVSGPFHPVSPTEPGYFRGDPITSKDAAKRCFGWQGQTVILRADRLTPRKNPFALMRVMGSILQRHPDAVLVHHSAMFDQDISLPELISTMPGAMLVEGAWVHPQVHLTRAHDTFRGMSDEDLNILYNAADIYVSPTMAEGFGLCLAEAAATGLPVVTTDYAAGPEVLGEGGVLIPVKSWYPNVYAGRWALCDEEVLEQQIEYLIAHPAKRRAIGEAGRRHVAQYNWDDAAGRFLALMGVEL